MEGAPSKKKITGKEPLTSAYLDILFNKKGRGYFDEKKFEKKYDQNMKNTLTKYDTQIEATQYKVDYLRSQMTLTDLERLRENRKEERADRIKNKAQDKISSGEQGDDVDIKEQFDDIVLTLMSENKKLQLELKESREQMKNKNKEIQALQKELKQYRQREVLYQDEIINIKVDEELRKEKGRQQYNGGTPYNQSLGNISEIKKNENNNNYSNNYEQDFWGNQPESGYKQNQYQNQNQNQNQNYNSYAQKNKSVHNTGKGYKHSLDDILGDDQNWANDYQSKKQEQYSQLQPQQQNQQQYNNYNNNSKRNVNSGQHGYSNSTANLQNQQYSQQYR